MDEHGGTDTIDVYAVVDQLLPPRTWKENPLLWIGVVVAVFMAVPFLASWATRVPLPPAGAAAQPTNAPVEPAQATSELARPQPDATAAASPQPAPARTVEPSDSSRQLITKCVEAVRSTRRPAGAPAA